MVWMPWVLFHTTASRAYMFLSPITGGAVSLKLVCDQRRTEKHGGKVLLNRTNLKMFGVFLIPMQFRC